MTREEIKRLADESEMAMANLCCNEIVRLDKALKVKWQEARAALHAAIDAIPNYQSLSAEIRNLEIALAKAHDAYGQLLVRRNLTDAALEPESKGESQ